ncbi:PIN domain-containing protein [Tolypothrix sp. VBCCA 56010]|uniref:PIN domain-containing protein n=1 Tax=Tolypothrix sp. VBCCA 56010 TaxID=3137731 RepID=UPI003D7EDD7D
MPLHSIWSTPSIYETGLPTVATVLHKLAICCIYRVTEDIATIYGQLKATLMKQFGSKEKTKRRKTKITELGFDENDLWIAAIALQHNLTIVSADSDFQRIQQVKALLVESWF